MGFDYYIFTDYSESLIGYCIIQQKNAKTLPPKLVKLRHYKELKYKREYFNSMKKLFEREKMSLYTLKIKVRNNQETVQIYSDVLEFIKKHTTNAKKLHEAR